MRALIGLAASALVLRLFVALRTAVPDRDAATYLWMAREVADGDLGAAFATVFHPLYPLLVAPWVALGGDVVLSGQIVSCVCASLALVPLCCVARRAFGAPAALVAGVLYAVGVWFVRHPADALSEGPFYLFVAVAVAGLSDERRRPMVRVAAGLCVGLAYGTRPEGAALVLVGTPWLWLRGERAAALSFALAAGVAVAVWPAGWALLGPGFTLTPKAAFNLAVGAGGAEAGGLAHYAIHLARVPGALFEAIGYVALPLAVLGIVRARPRLGSIAALCLGLVAVQALVVPLLRSNIRFLSGYGMLLLPFAGAGVVAVAPAVRRLARPVQVVLALAVVAGDLARLPQARRGERAVEREVGAHLGGRLRPGQTIATDMPRLAFYAGLRPPPPRPIPAREIERLAGLSGTAFVAFVRGRTPIDVAALTGFRDAVLPPALQGAVEARGMRVLARNPR